MSLDVKQMFDKCDKRLYVFLHTRKHVACATGNTWHLAPGTLPKHQQHKMTNK